ncbi:hypothetical protein [Pseudomaricurvus sp.]|uniref:hypothetical protein n=1 Tax=Pseudomaricurvus sp. TaxID=2004510 RepID=UPI003F6C4839
MIKQLILSALILTTSQYLSAGTVSQEEDKLDRFYQAFENRSSELEDIENELFGYDYKLERAQSDLKKAQADLDVAEKEYAKAKADLAANDSEDNQRAYMLAEHALKMSERGIRTRTKRLERVEGYMQELADSKSRLEAQVSASQRRIDIQEKQVAEAKKVAEARLAQAERARKEAERRMAEEKRLAAAAAVEPAIQPPAVVEEAPKVVKEEVLEEQVAAEQPVDEPADMSEAEEKELSELDKEALEYAQKEVERLEDLLSSSDSGRPTFRYLTLVGNKVDAKKFEFLGRDQYRVDTVVSKGRQIFEVGRNKFRRTIPASDDGQEYVFIYDAKRLSRPRLVMFKKSLIDGF